MSEMNKLNMEELEEVSGGIAIGHNAKVRNLKSGYLAIRTRPEATRESEIGALYNGDIVRVESGVVEGPGFEGTIANYVRVYSPKFRVSGYVNADYIEELSIYNMYL